MINAFQMNLSEAELFQDKALWEGGFIDADPLSPVTWSSYTNTGFVSVYHAAYLACIKPFVGPDTLCLEIGPGRGAWTKALFESGASRVIAVDVYDRMHNGIDAYLGQDSDRMEYIQTTTADLTSIKDGSCDYFCSFGCFVHLSLSLQAKYFQAIYPKLRDGAEGFVQIADLEQWNSICTDPTLRIDNLLHTKDINGLVAEDAWRELSLQDSIRPRELIDSRSAEWLGIDPGRYFYVGVQNAGKALSSAGFQVIDQNFIPSWRDPVIRFRKSPLTA